MNKNNLCHLPQPEMDIKKALEPYEKMGLVLRDIQTLFEGYNLVEVLQKMVILAKAYPDLVTDIKEQLDDEE